MPERREDSLIDQLISSQSDAERAEIQATLVREDFDRAYLRKRLLGEVQESREGWGTRGWLMGTLGRVLDEDEDAAEVFLGLFDEEPEPWVQYWALEGLWAGESVFLDRLLEQVEARENVSPQVEQLALAIRAHRGDEEALARLRKGLDHPDLHGTTLLALRSVPLPQLRSKVEGFSTREGDETVRRNAERALLRMQQRLPLENQAAVSPEVSQSGESTPPGPRHGAEILTVNAPAKVAAGALFKMDLRVRNTGEDAWPESQTYRVDVDARQPNRKARRLEEEWSGWFGESVAPGDEITITSPDYTAPDPGFYLLEIRLYGDSKSTSFPPADSSHELEVIAAEAPAEEAPPAEAPEKRAGAKAEPTPPADPTETPASGDETLPEEPAAVEEEAALEADASVSSAETPGKGPAVRPEEPAAADEPPELAEDAPEPVHVSATDLRKIGQGFASPPADAPTETVSHVVRFVSDLYRPPPGPRKLTLEVTSDTVKLKFANEPECVSPFKLDEAALRQSESDPIAYGRALFGMAINDDRLAPPKESTGHGYREAWRRTNGEMRLELVLYRDELQSLAWERLNAGDSYPPFAASERSPLYRRVDARPAALADPPLEVLVAIADPSRLDPEGKNELLSGLAPLDVAEQLGTIEPELKLLAERGVVRYRVVPEDPEKPLKFEDLSDALQKETHVLHLMAHGLRVKNKYHVVIGQGGGKRPFVDAGSFAELLLGANADLRLAVLQACNSGEVIRGEASNMALGTLLVRGGFPAVISMRRQLGLATARYFNNRFYFHLVRSEHVEMALAATRFNIYQRKIDGEGSWSVPVLHLGVDSGRLFGTDETQAARLPDEEPLLVRPEPTRRERTGADDAIEAAIRAASRKDGALDAGDVRSIREAAVKAATAVEPLARPQDRSRMNREMAQLVRLRGRDLKRAVSDETGLDVPDTAYDQVASALNTGKHVVLIGPPGTGKTSLAHAIAEYARRAGFSPGTIPTTASADWTTFDTVGGYVPVSADYLDFRPGIFLRAIASGCWLVLDEINRAEIDKAVGELFTVLSGQQVDLPYRVAGSPVRLLPARRKPHPRNWVPDEATGEYDYVVHPNWRILATMNVYDKSSLFGLSFAFMRRFAFVDVGIPDEAGTFGPLRRRWADDFESRLQRRQLTADAKKALLAKLADIFKADEPLMRSRGLGPAIAMDMIHYVFDRLEQSEPPAEPLALLGEAFLLYAVPQLDGLDRVAVREVYSHLDKIFGGIPSGATVLDRLETLYPHIRDWPARTPAAPQADGAGGG